MRNSCTVIKKQNMAGNKYLSFLKEHGKFLDLLDISKVQDMKNASGTFNMNQNIIDFSKDGARIWRF